MYLGIEIGGTKLQLGVGAGNSDQLIDLERRDIDSSKGAEGIREQILEAGTLLKSKHDIQAVGYGFGGPVNAATGCVLTSHQVIGWDDFPIVDWTQEKLGFPAILRNDCDAAALAESRFGAGRSYRTVFYVTVGTGVGGGLVIDGRLFGSRRPSIAEIGHLRPGINAVSKEETIESFSSGRGIETYAQKAIEKALQSDDANLKKAAQELLEKCDQELNQLTSKIICEESDINPIAKEALDQAIRILGWGISQMITILSPNIVVVGGGVSLIGEEKFFQPLRKVVEQYVFPPLVGSFEIVEPALGELVVVYGAVALASQR
jgi:glucokinase